MTDEEKFAYRLEEAGWQPRPSRRVRINIILFGATILTTLFAGALQRGADPFKDPGSLMLGLPFSAALLAILLTHELGHYIVSRHHGVDASLPYFLPVPNLIGTFGAFIMMRGPVKDRRALLDIGVAGPLAGFAVALPLTLLGLSLSRYQEGTPDGGFSLGSSLLFTLFSRQIFGPGADTGTIVLHPVAFAGWIGMLVTCLNLLPMGQLDGGHVAYALFGSRHKAISLATAGGLVVLGIKGWPGWFIWALLPLLMKLKHPSPLDPYTPLDTKRKLLALASLAVLALTFIPEPFNIF